MQGLKFEENLLFYLFVRLERDDLKSDDLFGRLVHSFFDIPACSLPERSVPNEVTELHLDTQLLISFDLSEIVIIYITCTILLVALLRNCSA